MWIDLYKAVTTAAGRYVQGGGCTAVGVAGLVQSGGFGSFSKAFGTAARTARGGDRHRGRARCALQRLHQSRSFLGAERAAVGAASAW